MGRPTQVGNAAIVIGGFLLAGMSGVAGCAAERVTDPGSASSGAVEAPDPDDTYWLRDEATAALILEGEGYIDQSRWRNAEQVFLEAITREPDNRRAQRGLSWALAGMNEESGIDSVADEWALLRKQTIATFDAAASDVRTVLEAVSVDAEALHTAEMRLIAARVTLDRNRDAFTQRDYRSRVHLSRALINEIHHARELLQLAGEQGAH